MRAVIQRVSRGCVRVDESVVGRIQTGLVVLLGAGEGDEPKDADYIAQKTAHLRIFPDDAGKMNRSVLDVRGGILVISQFTLYGDARHSRRPSFTAALEPAAARALCDRLAIELRNLGVASVETGEFGADMQVELVNDGPVTILLDSQKRF